MSEYLHAYWRMEYVNSPKDDFDQKTNPFMELPKIKDESKSLLIFRDQYAYCAMNKYPYNAGHLLVLPYQEISDLGVMTQEEQVNFFYCVCRAQKILKQALSPDGFNIGINQGKSSGAGIPQHLHCHIIPRWNGDTNFMPIMCDTRVLYASMETMWKRLREFV